MASEQSSDKVDARRFYSTWSGHTSADLASVYTALKSQGKTRFIWLAGESSLDNKHWLLNTSREDAVNGYEHILSPSKSVPDVCYWINRLLAENDNNKNSKASACIMTAVEESLLATRIDVGRTLLPQDVFIRDNCSVNDTIIVSVGGNDMVLSPTPDTIKHLARLASLPASKLVLGDVSVDHIVNIFARDMTQYLHKLTSVTKPRRILVCMCYFPCTDKAQPSWTANALRMLGYDRNPSYLQALVRFIYKYATCTIQLPGVEIVPVPLFDVLDANDANLYDNRVEPSVAGGKRMAE